MSKFWNLILLVLIFAACQSDSKTGEDNNADALNENPPMEFQMMDNDLIEQPQINIQDQNPNPQPSQVNIPAGPDGITHHYICNDRCKGGHSENPGNCPVCGKTLAHNQAWHDVQNKNQQQQANNFGPRADGSPAAPNVPNPQANVNDAPAQVNIPAGPDGIVHHYICPDRCSGGHSESPGKCSKCNKTLAHNQAWHNQ